MFRIVKSLLWACLAKMKTTSLSFRYSRHNIKVLGTEPKTTLVW